MADNRIRIVIEGVDQASGPINNINKSLGQMGVIAGGIGIAAGIGAITQGILGAGQAALTSYAQFERLALSLNSLTAKEALSTGQATNMQQALAQTSGKAKELLGWIQNLAIKSPFSQNDVAQAFRLSLAYGFTTNEAQRMTKAMLDFAAGSGASGDAMGRISLALGQIQARGKLSAQEMNQLSESGMNVRDILAKSMGISTAEVMKLTEKGLIPAGKAIEAIVAALEKDFGGAAERMGGTIGGLLESLGDIQDMTGRNLFGGMFQATQPYVADFTTVLSSPEFQAKVTAFGDLMGTNLAGGLTDLVGAIQAVQDKFNELPKELPPILQGLISLKQGGFDFGIDLTTKTDGNSQLLIDWFGEGGTVELDANMGVTKVTWDFGGGFKYDGKNITYQGSPIQVLVEPVLKPASDFGNWLMDRLGMPGGGNSWTLPSGSSSGAQTNAGRGMTGSVPYPDRPVRTGNARGTNAWRGGWTWVGEEGPELINLPEGTQVLSNPDSKALMRTGLADGTFGPPVRPGTGTPAFQTPLGGSLWQLLGLSGNKSPFGGFDEFTKSAAATTSAFGQAADDTAGAFADAAKKQAQVFESAIGKVQGLFGTSQVTESDMRKAKAGMPVNYADDYRRRLNDEVTNGKDWAGVDIKDAAKRLNIDPNLPQEIILEAFNAAWADSSLFANKDNLDLINMDAVKAGLEQQQKQLQGQVNLASLFGIDDKDKQAQSELLGAQIATVFGDAATPELMNPLGAQMSANMAGGFADATAATTAVNNMSGALTSALGLAENQTAVIEAGRTLADLEYSGYSTRMGELPPKPPSGTPPTTPPSTPPGKALGGYASGWTVVGEYGPELVNLGRGAYVYSNADSRSMGGGSVTNVYQTFTVNSELLAEMAARKAVALIKQRGR